MDGNNQQTNNQQGNNQTNTQPAAGANSSTQQTTPVAIDYDKLAGIVAGATKTKEETVLKNYFKQQGLSQEDAEKAITTFKQQQAANKPDVAALQSAAEAANKKATAAVLENKATLAAVQMGIDVKAIPYVLKMADLTQAIGQDGNINEETLKTALNKVLEDIPALKPQATQSAGFVQVGAPGSGTQTTAVDAELDRIFGVKK